MLVPPDNEKGINKGLPVVPPHISSSDSASVNQDGPVYLSYSRPTGSAAPSPQNGGATLQRSATTASLPPPYAPDAPPPPLPRRPQILTNTHSMSTILSESSDVAPSEYNTSLSVSSISSAPPSPTPTAVQVDWKAQQNYSSFAPPTPQKDWESSSQGSSSNGGTWPYSQSMRAPSSMAQLSVPGSPYAPLPEDLSSSKKKKEKDKSGLPPCFSRQPPYNMVASSFEPMFLTPTKNRLREGFPDIPPPSHVRPHPFVTHDVREADWTRFMTDLKNTATLGAGQITTGIVLPYAVYIPGATDYLSYKLRQRMYSENEINAAAIVDLWNHHFLRPRSLNAILMKGRERLSGKMDDQVKDLGLSPPSTRDLRVDYKAPDDPQKKKKSKGKDVEDAAVRLFLVPLSYGFKY